MNTLQIYVSRKGEPAEKAILLKDVTQVRVSTDTTGQTMLELTMLGDEHLAFNLDRYNYWALPKERDV